MRSDAELITTQIAGRILNVGPDTVRNLAKAGKLRVVMKVGVGGTRLFDKADVETLAADRATNRRIVNDVVG